MCLNLIEDKTQIIHPQLEHVDIEITRHCNYKCIHCSSEEHKKESLKELTTEEIKSIVDSSFKIGLNKIGFTGGEPLLEKDKLFELIRYSKNDYDLPIHIHSNGSLMNDETALKLKKYDVLTTISIYSIQKRINSLITRKNDSLNQSLNGIKNAIKNSLDLHIFIVPLKQNVIHIKDMIIKLNQLGANEFRILSLSPTGRALSDYENISLNDEQMERLRIDLEDLRENYGIEIQCGFCTYQNLPILSFLKGHDLCYSGKNRLHIDSYGNVYPCTAASGRLVFSSGNIRNIPLENIWFESPMLQYIRRFHYEKPLKCRNCTKYEECMGGCRVQMAYLYNDFTKEKPNCGGPYFNE